MRKCIFFMVGLGLFTAAACGDFSHSDFSPGQMEHEGLAVGDFIPDRFIVVLKRGVARNMSVPGSYGPRVIDVANSMIATYDGESIAHVWENALEGFCVRMNRMDANRLAKDPRVAYIDPDSVAGIGATQQNPPNWGLDRIDQRNLPLDSSYTYNLNGSGAHIYITDTGLRSTHNEFKGRVGDGYDAIGDGNGTSDQNGHGTHCAGIALGTTYGVAKGATVHPVQTLDSAGNGPWSSYISGLDWIRKNAVKPAVVSSSLTGGKTTSVDQAVESVVNAGITVVVAAGNSGSDACNYSPAGAPAAISVGNATKTDGRAGDSNYGSCLDIWAPGSSILSAGHTSDTASKTMSGTSMACPHVAGAVALYLSSSQNATPAQVTKAILDASTPNKINNPGAGSPNKLLYTMFDVTPTPTPDPTPDPNDPDSCVGYCGKKAPGGCWCDDLCTQYNDCCDDKQEACDDPTPTPTPNPTPTPTPNPTPTPTPNPTPTPTPNPTPTPTPNPTPTPTPNPTPTPTPNPTPTPTPNPTPTPDPGPGPIDPMSCKVFCGHIASGGCWCDDLCEKYNDCCKDKKEMCGY